jgi:ABC-2 type transport system ATP-binding protein
MTTLLIEAENLSRYYAKRCVVNDVSFTLAKGEVLGFLGPNGAGKTTTMQMLCGNLAPSTGQIKINGFDVLKKPQQAKQCLGYLPDTPPLYKELTVNEFLHYCAKLHRLPYRAISKAVNVAKERCGLNHVAERLIINLSKGYQQRVGIAQAILHSPEVIVLDEPTVGLDPLQIKEIRSLIKELGSEHGIILSTHILSEVQESCSHVQIINQGKLIFKESIKALDQRMNSSAVKLVTRKAINVELFSKLDGVNLIEETSHNHYLIQVNISTNTIEIIAESVINSGCGLLVLSPAQKSIEDIFISLTSEHEMEIK